MSRHVTLKQMGEEGQLSEVARRLMGVHKLRPVKSLNPKAGIIILGNDVPERTGVDERIAGSGTGDVSKTEGPSLI